MSQTTMKPEAGAAAEIPMKAEAQREHHWLRKLVGEWTYETDAPPQPEQSAAKATGSESVRPLGDVWILAEGRGEVPGVATATTLMTLGYDPQKKRFVGTWIGSMMPFLWVYDGELDAANRVLTLNSEGPSMDGVGTMARYQDVIEFKSDDHRTLTARTLTKDGTWQEIMKVHYRRATALR